MDDSVVCSVTYKLILVDFFFFPLCLVSKFETFVKLFSSFPLLKFYESEKEMQLLDL